MSQETRSRTLDGSDFSLDIEHFIEQIEAFVAGATRLASAWQQASPPNAQSEQGLLALLSATDNLTVAAEELAHHAGSLAYQDVLEAERQRYQDLFEFAPDGYLVTDVAGGIRQSNRAAAELLGVDPSRLVGKPLAVYVAPTSRLDFYSFLAQIPQARTAHSRDLRLRPRAGSDLPATLTAVEYTLEPGRTGLLWLIKDNTEREEMAQALRDSRARIQQLAHRLISVQEDERGRIARELHDEAGQALVALGLDLHTLSHDQGCGPAVAEGLARAQQALDDTLSRLHSLAVSLRPPSLDRLGLTQAIRQLVDGMGQNGLVRIVFQEVPTEKPLHLPPAVETTLYRIVQEALTNAVRHAQAHQISIVLHWQKRSALAIVEDDGVGLEMEAALASGRVGLLGMRERCEMLGGTLTVESSPGKGTVIYARVPFSTNVSAAGENSDPATDQHT